MFRFIPGMLSILALALFLLLAGLAFIALVTGLATTNFEDIRLEMLAEVASTIEQNPAGRQLAFALALPIVLIAGFSDAVGHSVILFANQVRQNRFAATLLINTALFVITYLLWVGSVAAVSLTIFQQEATVVRAMLAVAVSYIPLVYSFLIATPYLGVLLGNILQVLTAILLYQALQVTFPYTPEQALQCVLLGMLGVLAFRLTVGRPVQWLAGRLVDVVAGTRIFLNIKEAIEYRDMPWNRGD
jgi:hypothetical protein